MLSKKLRKAFERECTYLEYYDKHGEFPFKKKKITITLSLETIEKHKDKVKENKFSSFIESKIN